VPQPEVEIMTPPEYYWNNVVLPSIATTMGLIKIADCMAALFPATETYGLPFTVYAAGGAELTPMHVAATPELAV